MGDLAFLVHYSIWGNYYFDITLCDDNTKREDNDLQLWEDNPEDSHENIQQGQNEEKEMYQPKKPKIIYKQNNNIYTLIE